MRSDDGNGRRSGDDAERRSGEHASMRSDDRWTGPAGGCLELCRAVLEDAIRCVRGTAKRLAHDDPAALQRDAVRWLRSDRVTDPFDFVRVCDALGIDPGTIRRRVLAGVDWIAERHPRRRWTPGRLRVDLVALVEAGMPVKTIAAQTGLAPARVSIVTGAATRARKARRDTAVAALRADGWTLDRLAVHFGLSRARIVKILARQRTAVDARQVA